ncbi:hypothetical protein H1S01_03190 [Heliobacterium chlorum]|uniref:Uncharacterized protein n=1 Tax=Heliobacterium chlorum TaxID=2698 RepID=A0ABR7T1W0_HELCL|nr:hypothetical protein [Heliobacterium chlorum]MBC9783516.1 hypothetical protein [Heliobacterium chlorum]
MANEAWAFVWTFIAGAVLVGPLLIAVMEYIRRKDYQQGFEDGMLAARKQFGVGCPARLDTDELIKSCIGCQEECKGE